jgi:hypothetical protein
MKRIVLPVLFAAFLFAESSCVTMHQHKSWREYPQAPFFCRYRANDVTVIIDHVREGNIAKQVYLIADTHLESRQKNYQLDDAILLVDIAVEQRSFMRNLEIYNSVFVSCSARDEGGTVYARENAYITGKRTFIAVTEQNAIIVPILNRLLRGQQKLLREAQKYERNREKNK